MKADLFSRGLPEHKVDVELKKPQDLQTAMHLARSYERRAAAMLQPPPPHQTALAVTPASPTTGATPASTWGTPGAPCSADVSTSRPGASTSIPSPHAG